MAQENECWHGVDLSEPCDACATEQEAQFVAPPREEKK